jgi:hypothetical protein
VQSVPWDVGCEEGSWTELVQDRVQKRDLLFVVLKFRLTFLAM